MKVWKCTATVELYILCDEEPTEWEIGDEAVDEVQDNPHDAFGRGTTTCVPVTSILTVSEPWKNSVLRGVNPKYLTVDQVLATPPARTPDGGGNHGE